MQFNCLQPQPEKGSQDLFASALIFVLFYQMSWPPQTVLQGYHAKTCRSSVLPWVKEYVLLGVPMPGLNLSTAALPKLLLKAGMDHHKGE